MAKRLRPIRLRELAQLGLFAEVDDLDSPAYAGGLTNSQFDDKGRVACRNGYDQYLSSAISGTPTVAKLHYYAKEIGDTEHWIAAGDDGKLYKLTGAVGSGTATDITGAISTTGESDWQFANYNNIVVGLVQGASGPISWNGTGNFADYGSGAALPDGNCLIAAWGRLFGTTADGQQINWTATLGSDFDAVGSGQLNVRLVWPDGKDRIIAIAAFNNRLVIFGQRSILIYGDDSASQLDAGLDPNSTSFGLKETVEGVGLFARDGVTSVGNDLVFISYDGMRSLRRAVDYENHALTSLSENINPFILNELISTGPAASACSLTFDKNRGYLLLRLGAIYLYFDARRTYQDPEDDSRQPFYRAALWTDIAWNGIAVGDDGKLRLGFNDGTIGEYGGYLDDTSTYTMDVSSVWLSLEDGHGRGEVLKFLKRILLFASTNKTYTVNLRWQWDFSAQTTNRAITVTQDSAPAEWGLGEWGTDEWAGGATTGVYKGTTTGSGSGQYIKFGFSVAINDATFAYNALNAQIKTGRLSR